MICVVLNCTTPDELLATHRRLVDEGVLLVEWRLDFLIEPFDMPALLAQRPGPVIVTLRLPADGGHWRRGEDERRALLVAAMQAGAEYIDLEEPTAAALARTGASQRIVSMHDFQQTPDDLAAIHRQLVSRDADIVKLATLAQSTHDAFRMLDLVGHSAMPTVGLCMGELGTPTRLLAERWSAPFTYAALDGDAPPAPGQLSYHQMRDLYHEQVLDATTELFGVIGDPIAHSRSPLIHNPALHYAGLNAVYLPFRVPPADLPRFLNNASELGISGLSVTIPHKEAIVDVMTKPEPAVTAIGAGNTLVFEGNRVRGYNTDMAAAVDSLAEALGRTDQNARLEGTTALVLGAGGAAKAITYGLKQRGARVLVSNRTRERAVELAKPLGCEVVAWDERHAAAPDVLVNCTPLGMDPNTGDTPWDAAYFKSTMVVFDTVYTPAMTRLLIEAQAAGCRTVTGREMFVRQAGRQFELFTGQPAPLDVMRGALEAEAVRESGQSPLSADFARRNIVLIGYRGTGKTSVAWRLAAKLGWNWLDADADLERRAHQTIAEIFASQGEQAFRDWESCVVADVTRRPQLVLATGGGVVMRPQNRAALKRDSFIIWLQADAPTILARIAADPTTAARRPNLTTAGGEAEVRKLLAEREPIYRECADLTIDTVGREPAAVVDEILAHLRAPRRSGAR
ncbi:MAG: shikimate dehydrogenase [Planctomycetes bacterium]|nr:shikimate dehydrogenase [Planctomycetota bacterium]